MNTRPIYGNIICQNALPGIKRTLDSLKGVTDIIYICDGGSTDETWSWLESVKDIYRLNLIKHPFRSILKQRNFLLGKTPKESWIVALDQDEVLIKAATRYLRQIIHELVSEEQIKECHSKFVIHFILPFIQLYGDENHRLPEWYENGCKVFYYDEAIDWITDYHCKPHIKGTSEGAPAYWRIGLSREIAIKHYAFLDLKRNRERCRRDWRASGMGRAEWQFYCHQQHQAVPLEKTLQ